MGGAVLLFGCHALPTSPILLLDIDSRADRTTIKQDEVAQVSAGSHCLGDNVSDNAVIIIAKIQRTIARTCLSRYRPIYRRRSVR